MVRVEDTKNSANLMAFREFDSITEMFFHELRKSLPEIVPNDSRHGGGGASFCWGNVPWIVKEIGSTSLGFWREILVGRL